MMPRILVAGIGNIFMGDDAFGVEVVRELAGRELPDGVKVVDFGIRGFDLAYALLDGYDLTILVDAISRCQPAGTLYKMEPDAGDFENMEAEQMAIETHGMHPFKVLGMVKAMGGDLRRIVLVGCEPEQPGEYDEGRLGLSPAVSAVVRDAAAMVETIIRQANEAAVRNCGSEGEHGKEGAA
jgi:hydrogenase maturation protease